MSGGCRICGNVDGNSRLVLREMMMGYRERFPYFQCGACKSIGIEEVPLDMSRYYPSTYYSLKLAPGTTNRSLGRSLRGTAYDIMEKASYSRSWLYPILRALELDTANLSAIGKLSLERGASILDVGSGSGELLLRLKRLGFRELVGIDPYLERSSNAIGVELLKTDLEGLDPARRFDLIVFWHSLEHVIDPVATICGAVAHLNAHGRILVATPVVGYAFEKYGENWFQLDAPRHFTVFSPEGVRILVARTGTRLDDQYFYSNSGQFLLSERCSKDVALREYVPPYTGPVSALRNALSPRLRALRRLAAELNAQGRGDQAVFVLSAPTRSAEGPDGPRPVTRS